LNSCAAKWLLVAGIVLPYADCDAMCWLIVMYVLALPQCLPFPASLCLNFALCWGNFWKVTDST
ncbi:hypothetical protein U1Q18_033234, partial [Sarracenia purpurea var. burkii]